MELIAEYDAFLSEDICKHANKGRVHTSYLSSNVCDEFVFIMGKCFLDEIMSEIKHAGHFSVSMDSTPNVSNVDQLTCVILYVLSSGPVERFVHFLPMMKHTGLELATRLFTFLDQHGIDNKKCRGQSYDNASNMSGKYNGEAIILEKYQFAAFIPCAAHSLNLVGKCAAECCPGAVSFFDLMNQLYTYFSASTHRWRVLKEALSPCGLVVQKQSTTRWSSRI